MEVLPAAAPPPEAVGPVEAFYGEVRSGRTFKKRLRPGLSLQLRPTQGAAENLALLRDPASGVDLAFVQGGAAASSDDETLVSLGSMFRWGDAIIPTLKLDLKPLSIGFSYDVTVGRLASIARGKGGFEVSIAYTNFLNNDRSARDAVRCPSGF